MSTLKDAFRDLGSEIESVIESSVQFAIDDIDWASRIADNLDLDMSQIARDVEREMDLATEADDAVDRWMRDNKDDFTASSDHDKLEKRVRELEFKLEKLATMLKLGAMDVLGQSAQAPTRYYQVCSNGMAGATGADGADQVTEMKADSYDP